MFTEDELVPISALAHWRFCPRRVALIHSEHLWAENRFTVEGRILHETTDHENRKLARDARAIRSLRLQSLQDGLYGVADMVEFQRQDHLPPSERRIGVTLPDAEGEWLPVPVEFKRGKTRTDESYEVQLCAQALCLEEYFQLSLEYGCLYFGESGRRQRVELGTRLREQTRQTAAEVREALFGGKTPKPVWKPRKCRACSLFELCLPKTGKVGSVRAYLQRNISTNDEEKGSGS